MTAPNQLQNRPANGLRRDAVRGGPVSHYPPGGRHAGAASARATDRATGMVHFSPLELVQCSAVDDNVRGAPRRHERLGAPSMLCVWHDLQRRGRLRQPAAVAGQMVLHEELLRQRSAGWLALTCEWRPTSRFLARAMPPDPPLALRLHPRLQTFALEPHQPTRPSLHVIHADRIDSDAHSSHIFSRGVPQDAAVRRADRCPWDTPLGGRRTTDSPGFAPRRRVGATSPSLERGGAPRASEVASRGRLCSLWRR